MNVVVANEISSAYDLAKQAVILIVVSGQSILIQSNEHQGGITYDVFGTPKSELGDYERVMLQQLEEFDTEYPVQDIGTMVTYINKPDSDGRVRLTTRCYKLELTDDQKHSLSLKQNHLWLESSEVPTAPYLREDDKYFILRVLDGDDLNIVLDVDQKGKWIEAELLAVAEYSVNHQHNKQQ